MAMKDPRVPPMTLCGRRSGGFLKEPVYWCRKECMLWEVGGRPFLMKGSGTNRNKNGNSRKADLTDERNLKTPQHCFILNDFFVPLSFVPPSSTVICSASSERDSSTLWLERSVKDRRFLILFIFSMAGRREA
ncbi:hypothetical protein EYF80_042258 [Liparis tanakae]|uniref:Uncharacterized protein n=1 Tax=Liparis tanakae TaxID=230148 RepID=A0A4Z2G207_9TELE|nr:hypothetical protein EYF80_042258 [Liparis tanakae]